MPFHHWRGQHARLAEQFECDARAHNVHDGIHRADFVKMNLVRRQPVDFSLGFGNALENGDGFLFHPRGKFAARNELLDFGKIPAVVVLVVVMVIVVIMVMIVIMVVTMMMMLVRVVVRMFVVIRQMHVEFHAFDAGFLFARDVQVVAVELQFFKFVLQLVRVRAQINHRADEHVAADAAEDVEVKRFHLPDASALICARRAARAEAVVNVHHGHAAAATVQHAQQRRHAAEARAVAHARRHRNDRLGHQPRDDARQRALHAGDHHKHVRLLNRFQPAQNAVQPGHARVRHALDAVAHDLRRHRRLFRHRQIARARANHHDGSGPPGQRLFFDGDAPRQFVMDGELEFPAQFPRLLRRDARDEDALFVFQEPVSDFQDLLRRLARAEDDFWKTLAQRAVRVHLREAEVGEGRGLEGAQHLVPAGFAGAKFLQQSNCFNGSHGMKIAQKPRAVTPENNLNPAKFLTQRRKDAKARRFWGFLLPNKNHHLANASHDRIRSVFARSTLRLCIFAPLR